MAAQPPAKNGVTYQQASTILQNARNLPRLIVYDLDYTIWPCYCECETSPPRLYPQVVEILEACKAWGVRMAVASRSPTPELARSFLAAHGLAQYFDADAIYPSTTGNNKNTHFKELADVTGVELSEMLFFDDELGNIRAANLQGTCAVHCEDGVTLDVFHQGIENYAMRGSEADELRF